jgi:hypothetical protein
MTFFVKRKEYNIPLGWGWGAHAGNTSAGRRACGPGGINTAGLWQRCENGYRTHGTALRGVGPVSCDTCVAVFSGPWLWPLPAAENCSRIVYWPYNLPGSVGVGRGFMACVENSWCGLDVSELEGTHAPASTYCAQMQMQNMQ